MKLKIAQTNALRMPVSVHIMYARIILFRVYSIRETCPGRATLYLIFNDVESPTLLLPPATMRL
jgi:hypothetical protein